MSQALNRETRLDRQPLVTPHPLQLTPAQAPALLDQGTRGGTLARDLGVT